MDVNNLKKVLIAIAEGYPVFGLLDRYILVDNPDYEQDNGKDPRLLFDIRELDGKIQF